ncbi:hypothetical protein CONCODRAFT_88313 [Conidiobolus coronatus NRRL 28638]|uniref:Cyclin N-terminal domain-containing protein n=1 Tax=Conidiobolus coronatus (strain ATCC 28846 / CBS 209.66 / NRRL 28638) TaxID=796925 RepID=A0A137PJ14_CONC2|nr:hypothetical protein CONCODRAFT_88313 [Conidiobolus coronatus NRRL 28638]|eukprot:KXN74998.1 hypothetical protein CONCODRAFT_88313 [Conidiobolus coronatus NRRL 28638]
MFNAQHYQSENDLFNGHPKDIVLPRGLAELFISHPQREPVIKKFITNSLASSLGNDTTKKAEQLSQLTTLCDTLILRSQANILTLIGSLCYFFKLFKKHENLFTSQPTGIYAACFIISHKFFEDQSFGNQSYSGMSNTTLEQLNFMELSVLMYLDFDLYLDQRDMVDWFLHIRGMMTPTSFNDNSYYLTNHNGYGAQAEYMNQPNSYHPTQPIQISLHNYSNSNNSMISTINNPNPAPQMSILPPSENPLFYNNAKELFILPYTNTSMVNNNQNGQAIYHAWSPQPPGHYQMNFVENQTTNPNPMPLHQNMNPVALQPHLHPTMHHIAQAHPQNLANANQQHQQQQMLAQNPNGYQLRPPQPQHPALNLNRHNQMHPPNYR